MENSVDRVAAQYLAATDSRTAGPVEGPLTAYDDWLENTPIFANVLTLTPMLARKLYTVLKLRSYPLALRFFHLTDQIHHMALGAPVEDVSQQFRAAARVLSQTVLRSLGDVQGAEIANAITDCAVDNMANLRRIGGGAKGPIFTKVGLSIAMVIEKMANAAGIPAGYQIKTLEGIRWPTLRIMSKRDRELKTLQENNPELYTEVKETLSTAEMTQHEELIRQRGMIPRREDIGGVPLVVGEDPISMDRSVYLPGRGVVPEDTFRREQMMKRRAESLLTSEFHSMAELLLDRKGNPILDKDGKQQSVPIVRPDKLEIEGVRKLADDQLDDPDVIPRQGDGSPVAVKFRALTDDKAAAPGTRIYATRPDKDGRPVVVEGRFKGFYLDDMVNSVGRVVEGTAYDVDKSGAPIAFNTLNEDGTLSLRAVNKEPYVTLDTQGRFLIKIPVVQGGGGKKDPFTRARTQMKSLASKPDKVTKTKNKETGKTERKVVPGYTRGTSIIELLPTSEEETGGTLFTFEAQDFNTVKNAVGGMCMSAAAAKKLRDFYQQQARQEDALKRENLDSYSLDRIGGFKVQVVIDPETGEPFDPPELTQDLMIKQKEALSWIEAKGYKGLAALDTGVGKTLLCIGTMQKMIRDGAAAEGSRFLYVCPKSLRGNFPRELRAWMTEEAAEGLMSRVDVMSYEDYTKTMMGTKKVQKMAPNPDTGVLEGVTVEKQYMTKAGEVKVRREPVMVNAPPAGDAFAQQYAAVFFDEAQNLVKDENSNRSRAAQYLNHPRKILLTASPMEDDPDELYIGVAITDNVVLTSKAQPQPKVEGETPKKQPRGKITQARKDLMAFRRRFCVRVAGRTIGIKAPSVKDAERDPTMRQDFDAWAKNGMYVADKRTVGTHPDDPEYDKSKALPELRPFQQGVSLTMDPEVEAEYRKAAKGVATLLKALVTVFRDKSKVTGPVLEKVKVYQSALKGYMTTLDQLANAPDEVIDPETGQPRFPGKVSPKIASAAWIVSDKVDSGGKRTLMFTDDPKFAVRTAREISANIPGQRIAVALADKVMVFMDGKQVTREDKAEVYTPRIYTKVDGTKVPKKDWASFVLSDIIGGDPSIVGLVLTKNYALGQNLQMFSTVVHLDRDNFSSEMMKQRTARAWRTGQKEPVEEYTLDAVYDTNGAEKTDPTLDEVRRFIQTSQEQVFNDVVHESRNVTIGEEWRSMGEAQASLVSVNKKLMELALAPYPAALADHDYQQAVQGS
jgi:hypothetical protein